LPAKKRANTPSPPATAVYPDSPFTSEYLESEVDGERVGVTLWDSQGLEKSIVDIQLPLISAFLESKFEDTFTEEQKVVRAPGVRDTHIHCVFLILDPARLAANITESHKAQRKNMDCNITGGLDENLDLNVLRELQGKTTVIPVISKADTVTTAHMRHLKKMVWDTIKRAKLDPLEALHLTESDDEDDDLLDERDEDAYVRSDSELNAEAENKTRDRSSSEAGSVATSQYSGASQSPPTSPPSARKSHSRKPSAMSASIIQKDDTELPYLPLSIISPDPYEPEVVGRKFPWGFADPYNVEHCDFVRLRESVFSEWRSELREASREQWYEGWRTNRLQRGPPRRGVTSDGPAKHQLTVPSANGRASSAGSREYRQGRSAGF
jgi:septin family protein